MASLETINKLLTDAAEKLDRAAEEIRDTPLEPTKENIQLIGESLANIFQIQHRLFKKAPNLRPAAEILELVPDPEISKEERALIDSLSSESLENIDMQILSQAGNRWQKVAKIVGMTMIKAGKQFEGFSDLFYAERIKILVDKQKLEAQGNLNYMRFSEVRLPNENG